MEYQGLPFQKVMRLLALAMTPEGGTSISDWRPFAGGETLDVIINNHNVKCIECYEKGHWLPEQIVAIVDAIIEIEPYDLSTVNQLLEPRYESIRIIVVDLDHTEQVLQVVDNVKYRAGLHSKERELFLVQSAGRRNAQSLENEFRPLPTSPYPSPIFTDQGAFQNFLSTLYDRHCAVARMFPIPPPDDGDPVIRKVNQAYIEAMPRIAAEARDIAVMQNYSVDETVELAGKAAMQEFRLLKAVEEARTDADLHVNVDAIRQPLAEIPIGSYSPTSDFQTLPLLKLNTAHSIGELSQHQRMVLSNLGISGDQSASIQIDQPDTRNLIAQLGDAVQATEFSAELPRW